VFSYIPHTKGEVILMKNSVRILGKDETTSVKCTGCGKKKGKGAICENCRPGSSAA